MTSGTVLPVPKMSGKMGPSTMIPWRSRGHLPGPALRGVVAPLLLLALALPTCSRRESAAQVELEEAAATSAAPEATQGDLSLSVDAKPETFELLREDLETVRSPADGGGRAWLESSAGSNASGRRQIPAGSRQRFSIVYQAGPLGVAPGGAVFLQVSPFWEWDWPQIRFPEGPGYTEVTTRAEGVELQPENWGQELLAVQIAGRKLEAGDASVKAARPRAALPAPVPRSSAAAPSSHRASPGVQPRPGWCSRHCRDIDPPSRGSRALALARL